MKANFKNKKSIKRYIILSLVALTLIGIGAGGWWLYESQSQSASASELINIVEKEPDACLEDMDQEQVKSSLNLMAIVPRSLSEDNINANYDYGFITQCQCKEFHEELNKLKTDNKVDLDSVCEVRDLDNNYFGDLDI